MKHDTCNNNDETLGPSGSMERNQQAYTAGSRTKDEDLDMMAIVEERLRQHQPEALLLQHATDNSLENSSYNTSNVAIQDTMAKMLSRVTVTLPPRTHVETTKAMNDTVIFDLKEGTGGIPVQAQSQSTPTDTVPPQQAQSYVGAYAVGGITMHDLSIHSHNSDHTNSGTIDSHNTDQNHPGTMVVADPVHDDDLVHPKGLPMAESIDADSAAKKRAARTKESKTYTLLVVIFVLALVTILVAVLIPWKQEPDDDVDPAISGPSSSPSQLPTSVEQFYLSLLPESTVLTILEAWDSPQANAFRWLMQDVNLLELTHEQIKQRFALASLFYATNGHMWLGKNNWLNHSVNECEWEIKSVFAEKTILVAYGLKGLLSEMFPSTEPAPTMCNENGLIQHLWLDKNDLKGTLPLEIYMLTSLKTISIGSNSLPGSISSYIGQLTMLEGWASRNVEFSGSIPTEIGLLSNLKALVLTTNDIEGPMPTQILQLTNLETMAVAENRNLKGTIPSEIAVLSKLRWIGLHETGFSGTVPSTIGLLRKLEWLDLLDNHFLGTLPTEIGQLTKLTMLTAFGNTLEGSLPTELGLLTGLNMIRVGGNQFTGPVPSELGLLTNLEVKLNLDYNQLSGPIPTQLGLLTRLTGLNLNGNQLTGPIPSEFGLLTNLGTLTLANNSLSGSVPQELLALQPTLYALGLEGNLLLSGTIPEGLCSFNTTCIEDALRMCESAGLSFDCSNLICGCECSCAVGQSK